MGIATFRFLIVFLFVGFFVSAQIPTLWGMTYNGGDSTRGVLFKIKGDGSGFSKLYSFKNSKGSGPSSSLLMATNGKFYGSTNYGGNFGYGVFFSFDTIFNNFVDIVDFNGPNGNGGGLNIIQASNNKLYSVTFSGGSTYGNIFSYSLSTSTYSTVYNFSGLNSGWHPRGGLCQATNGYLYGTSTRFSPTQYGTIYSFDPSSNTFSDLHDFINLSFGGDPIGSLLQTTNGKIYGTTEDGGLNSAGVIFSFDIGTGTYTRLFDFSNINGVNPNGGLIQATDGKLYGLTKYGGSNNMGTLYSFDISNNNFSTLFNFDLTTGSTPKGSIYQASDGLLYGTASQGGANGDGTIFKYSISGNNLQKIFDFNNILTGKNPLGGLIDLQPTLSGIKQDMNSDNRIKTYPNPVSNILYISIQQGKNEEIGLEHSEIEITNTLGQIILKNHYSITVDVSKLSPGFYNLKIISKNKQIYFSKFVKE